MFNDKATQGLSQVMAECRCLIEIQGKRLPGGGGAKGRGGLPRVGWSQGREGSEGREERGQAERDLSATRILLQTFVPSHFFTQVCVSFKTIILKKYTEQNKEA